MAFMDKFLSYMKLNDEETDDEYYDEEDEYLDEEDEYEEKAPVRKVFQRGAAVPEQPEPVFQTSSKVTPIRSQSQSRRSISNASGMEVCVMRPQSIEDAREITDTLRSGRSVVLNLEGLRIDVAQRIIDFASGSSYAIDGNLQMISRSIFIITPKTVDISGDFQDAISDSLDVENTIRPIR